MSDIEQSELDMENSEFNPLDHFAVRQRASEIRAQATRKGLKAIGYFVRDVWNSAVETHHLLLRRSAQFRQEPGNSIVSG